MEKYCENDECGAVLYSDRAFNDYCSFICYKINKLKEIKSQQETIKALRQDLKDAKIRWDEFNKN